MVDPKTNGMYSVHMYVLCVIFLLGGYTPEDYQEEKKRRNMKIYFNITKDEQIFIYCEKGETYKSIEEKVKNRLGYKINTVNYNIVKVVYEQYKKKRKCKSIEKGLKNFI